MRSLLILFFLVTGIADGYSQDYIGKSENKALALLEKYNQSIGGVGNITKTDSTILLSITDSSFKKTNFVFRFHEETCIEETKLSCESCIQQYLDQTLSQKSFQWKKINDSTYISTFSKHQLMTVQLNGDQSSLQLKKLSWNRNEYRSILASVKRVPGK